MSNTEPPKFRGRTQVLAKGQHSLLLTRPDKLLIKSRRVGHPYAQTNTNHIINHDTSYKEMGVEPNRMSFLCGNRSRHHNTEIIKWRHTIEQNEHCGDFIGCKNNIPSPSVSSCIPLAIQTSAHRHIPLSHLYLLYLVFVISNLVHMTCFWNNHYQVRFWNNFYQVRFWNNLYHVHFWNNIYQVRFWNNLYWVRSRSKDLKGK